ncbi:MAG: OmpA family protein [Paludibacteraceae bacterium]|nr:OmpA family protein [Paludibacteraceae bacterium]MBR6104702.1 OmpA family protein [Paludibacteraceae bacterium]
MVKFKSVLLFLLAALLSGCSVNQTIKRADKKYEIGEYYKAASIYKIAYTRVSATKERQKKAYVAYRMGECYSLVNENNKAEMALKNATRYKYADTTVYLLYADVLRKNKKPQEAIKNYEVFLAAHPKSEVALAGKESSVQAIEWMKNPTRYKVKKMDAFVSKRTESSPSFPAGDSTTVYFASTRVEKGEKRKNSKITGLPTHNIYMSRQNSAGAWDNIEAVEGEINTADDEGSPSFSADGKTMFFTRCRYVKGETHGAEIYCAKRNGGKWGKPVKVELSKDSSISFAHPTVSSDGKVLYFVSDMQGGFGGKDIWFSVNNGEKWGAPQNAGPKINTAGDEMFPFLRHDTLLYYSSNGLPGFGGLDIFCATLSTDGQWKNVKNMMYPINSNMDDFGISFVEGAESGMFSSNRDDRKGYDRIYSFVLPPVVFNIAGKVTSTSGEPLPDAIIRIVGNDGTNLKIHAKKDGSFSYPLNRNVKYVMLGNCRGYLNQKDAVRTDSLDDSHTFKINLSLASVSKPVGLDNIFFEFGKATLTKESDKSLDKLVKLLNDNPNITIEIGAHTDRVGSAEGNLRLSGERAESVVNYLIKKGIEAERLTAKGYGKSTPVVVDAKLAKQYSFLHDGQVLDDGSLDQMNAEQQEIANQINRRTEFRVLKTTYKMY